jgi:hypothetical protein
VRWYLMKNSPGDWSSRLRTLTSPIAADVSWLPAAPKVRKNLIKEKRQWGKPPTTLD